MGTWSLRFGIGLGAVVLAACSTGDLREASTSEAGSTAPPPEGPAVQVDRVITMLPGAGRNPEVEAKLDQLDLGYIAGSGAHVATFANEDGPHHFYMFHSDDSDREPLEGFAFVCLAEAPEGDVIERIECGITEVGPAASRGIRKVSTRSDGPGISTTIRVGPDVESLVVELANGELLAVVPAGGIAFTGTIAGRVMKVTAFASDGSEFGLWRRS